MAVAHGCGILEVSMTTCRFYFCYMFSGCVPVVAWKLSLTRLATSPSPNQHNKLTWTEPARHWHKSYLLACRDHSVPEQIVVMSLALPFSTAHADDRRSKRKPKDNSIFPHGKRKPLLSFWRVKMLLAALSE